MKHYVYAYFDAAGRVLYVGSTNDSRGRDGQHRRKSAWYPEVVTHKVREYASKPAALKVEAGFIWRLRPIHNVLGTTRRNELWPINVAAEPDFISQQAAMNLLGIGRDCIRRWTANNYLPHVADPEYPERTIYPRAALIDWKRSIETYVHRRSGELAAEQNAA